MDGDAQNGHVAVRICGSKRSVAPQDWHEISSWSEVAEVTSVAIRIDQETKIASPHN
jgi:hypothetical protein